VKRVGLLEAGVFHLRAECRRTAQLSLQNVVLAIGRAKRQAFASRARAGIRRQSTPPTFM